MSVGRFKLSDIITGGIWEKLSWDALQKLIQFLHSQ